MDKLLNKLLLRPEACDERWLIQMMAALRPRKQDDFLVDLPLIGLCDLLQRKPEYCQAFSHFLQQYILNHQWKSLFTDSGIPDSKGFAAALWERMIYRLLPPLVQATSLKDKLGYLFARSDDHEWLAEVSPEIWATLGRLLFGTVDDCRAIQVHLQSELYESIQVLSYRISTIGLEPELIRNYPSIEQYESPFIQQNVEVMALLQQIKQFRSDAHIEAILARDGQHIEVLLGQCEVIIGKVRKAAQLNGVSISLTRLLLKLGRSIDRLKVLLALTPVVPTVDKSALMQKLGNELIHHESLRHRVSPLLQSNTELLALQITEHAGKTGEHYVASDKSEWLAMWKSAMGAGFVIAWMALIKLMIGKLSLSPLGFAILYSLNYGIGFMLIHILHFTVATKQPAMTANMLAASMDKTSKNKTDRLSDLVDLCAKVMRTQWIAIVGNIMIAIPMAILIALSIRGFTGHALATPEKAAHLLADLDPYHSLALFHAAIAGVCLFLSGLISGYYDNKASYNHIPQRLAALPWLQTLLGRRRLARVVDYIGNNLGALTGNFFFGCMLGTIGIVGAFVGLPVDIRHIAFSSANWGFALTSLDWHVTWHYALYTFAGFLLVGMVNLLVSFSLALSVAMRARQLAFSEDRQLLKAVARAFLRQPLQFFFPPKTTPVVSEEKSS